MGKYLEVAAQFTPNVIYQAKELGVAAATLKAAASRGFIEKVDKGWRLTEAQEVRNQALRASENELRGYLTITYKHGKTSAKGNSKVLAQFKNEKFIDGFDNVVPLDDIASIQTKNLLIKLASEEARQPTDASTPNEENEK